MPSRPVMLVILDGFGWREERADNAVRLARTPSFDALWAAGPHAFLRTSGEDVGLPDGQMGNSEVGHLNIGAGRVVMQELPRIGRAIADGSLARAPVLVGLIEALRASGGTCHLMGLVSDGGVHSHQDHAAALARILAASGVPTLVHAFTDGRDTAPTKGADYLARLGRALPDGVRIATVTGRYYAMDRDQRWERVARAWRAVALGEGTSYADVASVMDDAQGGGVTDEFVVPAVIGRYRGMADGDGLLCFNFRADRVRELLAALLEPDFAGFERARVPRLATAAGLTRYGDELAAFMEPLFPPQSMSHILGAGGGRGGADAAAPGRDREVPARDLLPERRRGDAVRGRGPGDGALAPRSRPTTCSRRCRRPSSPTGPWPRSRAGPTTCWCSTSPTPTWWATPAGSTPRSRRVEAVDAGLGRIAAAVRAQGGALLVTADHGNCELMRDPASGGPHTAHTTNLVPVVLVAPAGRCQALRHDGRLADVAPTLLALMGLAAPAEMTGHSLLQDAPG